MGKSGSTKMLDAVQARLAKLLQPRGYVRGGRTFRRDAGDGVVQVVNLQMRAFATDTTSPPAMELVDRFTVNLGIFIPELQSEYFVGPAVHEYDCAVRMRIGFLMDPPHDHWWDLSGDADALAEELLRVMEERGLPFLDRFATRDAIVAEWIAFSESTGSIGSARVDVAILHAARGEPREARALLRALRSSEDITPSHADYLDALAARLGLDPLEP